MRREQGPKQCLLWKMQRSQKRDDREFRITLEAVVWMGNPLPCVTLEGSTGWVCWADDAVGTVLLPVKPCLSK